MIVPTHKMSSWSVIQESSINFALGARKPSNIMSYIFDFLSDFWPFLYIFEDFLNF